MWRVGRPESTEVVRVSGASSFRELDDAFLQTQARIWLGEVLHIRFDEETAIADLLADGELLFQVSRVIWKKLAKKYVEMKNSKVFIHEKTSFRKSDARYMPYPKVDSFLKLCQIIGLTGIDLFSPSDVVEKRNVRKVCLCLRSLSIKARAKELKVPDFDVVTYTIVMPTNLVGGIRRYLEQSRCNLLSSSSHINSREQYKKKNCSGNHDQFLESYPESNEEDGDFTELEIENTASSPLHRANASSFREEFTKDGNGEETFESQEEFQLKSPDHCQHEDANAEYRKGILIQQSIESGFGSIHENGQDESSVTLQNKENDNAYHQALDSFEMRQINSGSYWRVNDGHPIGRDDSQEESSQISYLDSNSDDFDYVAKKKLLEDSIIFKDNDTIAERILLAKSQECSTTTDSSFTSDSNVLMPGVCNSTTENQYVPVDLVVEAKETLYKKTHTESTANCYMVNEELLEAFTESSSSVFGADTRSEHSASSSEEIDSYISQLNLMSPRCRDFNELNNSSEERTSNPILFSMLSTSDADHLVQQQILEGTVDHSAVSGIQFLGCRKCEVTDSCATAYNQCSNGHCNSDSIRKHTNNENLFPGYISEISSCSTTRCIALDEGIIREKQIEVQGQVPMLSHNSVIGMRNIIANHTQDKDEGTEKHENRAITPSTSSSKEGEQSYTKSGHLVLKSIAGGVTLIGTILFFVHLRIGKGGTRSMITKWLFLHKFQESLVTELIHKTGWNLTKMMPFILGRGFGYSVRF